MFQKVIIVGNLGRDPEMRYMPDGTGVTSFSVATSSWRKEGNATAWFRVTVWGKQAEACNQYLQKGKQVLVEGELDFDTATGGPKMFDRNDGSKGVSFEVRANTVKFLSGGSHADAGGDVPATTQETQKTKVVETSDDDLIF